MVYVHEPHAEVFLVELDAGGRVLINGVKKYSIIRSRTENFTLFYGVAYLYGQNKCQ